MNKVLYTIPFLLVSLLLVASTYADDQEANSGEEINWQVVSGGGTDGSSTNYGLVGTVGQIAVRIHHHLNSASNHD